MAVEWHRAVHQDVEENAEGPAVHLPQGEVTLEGGSRTRPPPTAQPEAHSSSWGAGQGSHPHPRPSLRGTTYLRALVGPPVDDFGRCVERAATVRLQELVLLVNVGQAKICDLEREDEAVSTQQGPRGCAAPPAIRELSSSGLGRNQSPLCHPGSCPHFGHPPDVPGEGSIPTFPPALFLLQASSPQPPAPRSAPPAPSPPHHEQGQLCSEGASQGSAPARSRPREAASLLLCPSWHAAVHCAHYMPLPSEQKVQSLLKGYNTRDNTQPFHLQPHRPRGGRHKGSSTTRISRARLPHSVLTGSRTCTGSRRTQPAWLGARRSDFALLSAAKQTLVALAAGARALPVQPLPWQPKGGFGSPPGPHLLGWLPQTTASSSTGDRSSLWASRAPPGR